MKQRFSNPHVQDDHRTLLDVFYWKMGKYREKVPSPVVPPDFVFPVPQKQVDEQKPKVRWINHSTFLLEIDGMRILTDPIWSERCSPFSFLGPKRRHAAPISIKELPPIDLVLISHDHYDHLDEKSVLALHRHFPQILWLVPTGVKRWFEKRGISHVVEKGWWEEIELAFPQLTIKATATPTQHFSGRKALQLNRTLWMGWVVQFFQKHELKKSLYFVGDTGYNPIDFKAVGDRFGKMDLSLIPIGCYIPRDFMSCVHIEPENAVRIHQEVKSQLSLGMHWKTFHLSDEPMNQPPYDLFLALQKAKIDPHTFLAVEPGHALNW